MPNRIALITGGSKGIGLATALRLAKAGCHCALAARNENDLEQAVEQVSQAGGECIALTADLTNPDDARGIVEGTVERFGRLDIVVNNAGSAPLAPIDEMGVADFDQVIALNINAVFHVTQAAWPVMKKQGGGVIVNISSMASLDPLPGFQVYGATKAWVNVFSKATATEGKPHGIRVFSVAPGAVETTLLRSVFPDIDAAQTLDPDQIAAVVESVCDERMAAATGETIFAKK